MSKQFPDTAKPKDTLKALKILVIALVTGVSIFAAIVLVLLLIVLDAPLKEENPLASKVFFGLAVVVAIVCLFAAN